MKLGKYIIPPPLCLPLVIHQLSLKRTLDVGNANNIIEVALLSEESKSKHLQFAATDVTDHIFFFSNEFSSYEKYARWQARTNNPFIDYFAVLDIGLRWEKRSYGKLSGPE